MAAEIMDGKLVSNKIKEEIKKEVQSLGIKPGLAVVLIGENPASKVYVRNKRRACENAGFYSEEHKYSTDITEDELLSLISKLNNDERIHGILVQLPLPGHINSAKVLDAISPEKDVDGFHPYNIGKLLTGNPTFSACTPYGIMKILEYYKIELKGKNAVVVGRSNIVGKPIALMLLQEHATVTICHSRTRNIEEVCRNADILIAAVGKAKMITKDMVKKGAAVVDVGINRLDDGTLVGDCDFEGVSQNAAWITPVPGGVGPMTIAMLLSNTLDSAKRKRP